MSNFLFGVAFERLLFNALNRYLLKNSSSIETEIRSLILPLEDSTSHASLEYLSLYLKADTAPSFSKLWKPAAISGTLYIPCQHPNESLWDSRAGYFGQPTTSYNHDFTQVPLAILEKLGMQEKQTILLVLFSAWLFWFALFLSIGI